MPHSRGGWRNLEHMTGAYSEHAEAKRYTQRRGAWGDAHRAAGTHRTNGTSRKRSHTVRTRRCAGPTGHTALRRANGARA